MTRQIQIKNSNPKSTKGGQVLVHRSCTLKPAKVEKMKKNEENQQEEWGKAEQLFTPKLERMYVKLIIANHHILQGK